MASFERNAIIKFYTGREIDMIECVMSARRVGGKEVGVMQIKTDDCNSSSPSSIPE